MIDPIDQRMSEGDFDGAAAALQVVLDRDFTPERGVQQFGIHAFRDDPDAAEAVLRKVVEMHPALNVQFLFDCLSALRVYLRRRESPQEVGRRTFVLGRGTPAPPAWLVRQVQASVEHASGRPEEAARAIEEVKRSQPALEGTLTFANGTTRTFSSIRDADDLVGMTLSCFSGPQLLDIPLTEIASVGFGPVRASWDTIWRPITVVLRDDRQLGARMPARYPGSGSHPEATVRMGSMTLFDHDRGYCVASGMIDYFLDDAVVGVGSMASLRFA